MKGAAAVSTGPPATAAAAPPRRRLGGTFVAGARGRLLPLSVPMRFFAAAAVFHALAWAALYAGADAAARWHGGLGWALAALHLVTLGTLVASAIGASLQVLPVATRQPVRWPRAAAALWWGYVPGVALLAAGMGLARPAWLAAGAAAVVAALLAWALLLALNLRGARGMPGVVLHGWGALAALALLLLSATALVLFWLGRPWLDHAAARALHLAAGVFGVMGLLAFGVAYILLPMFALAAVPDERQQLACGALALLGVALAALAPFVPLPLAARAAALVLGTAAFVLHVRLMHKVLATGMRRRLGRSGALMRLSWAALGLALAFAAADLVLQWRGAAATPLARPAVAAAVGGWLLSFVFGVLQRMLPFLGSMHAAALRRRAPTPSALTCEGALAVHAVGHVAALVLLGAALLTASPLLVRLAALAGLTGALAFAVFCTVLLWRLAAARPEEA